MRMWMLLLGMTFGAGAAGAVEEAPPLKTVHITMDQKTLQHGAREFVQVCMGCHSLRYVTWKHLMDYPEIGFTREQVDEMRGDAPLTAPLATMLSEADAKASYGIVPPDLTLMARAREGGGAYIYSLLLGYEQDPAGRIPEGNYNRYFPGRHIAMADPLGWLDHDAEDEADLKEQARAVASFLAYVAEPHQLERRALGQKVLIFLVVMTLLFWLLKREVWRDVH